MADINVQVAPKTLKPRKAKSFARDVLTLGFGTSLAQAVTILAAPIITRLYGPDAFGLAALFLSLAGIGTVISCLRFEMAIMLPETNEEAANLLALSMGIVFLISLLTIPVVWFGGDLIVLWLKSPELKPYLWFLPGAVFLGGIFLALNYWSSRARHFGRLSVAKLSQSTVTAGTQLGTGFVGFATGGSLIGSTLIGSFVAVFTLSLQVLREDFQLFKESIRFNEIIRGFKRHKKFPLFDTWATLLNNISWQLPTFLLATFFSKTEVGYYALGNRLLRIPMSIIGAAIAQVFFQRASEALKDGTLASVVENVFRSLVSLGMFPMLVATIIGRDLFVVVFSPTWAEAGVYTQILSIWMFFWFISSPLSTLFRVLEKQEFSLVLNIVIFATRFITLGIGGLLGSTRIALILFSSSGVILYGYLCWAIVQKAGVPNKNIIRILLSNFAIFIPAAIILISLKIIGVSSLFLVGIAFVILMIYAFYLFRFNPSIRALIKTK